MPINEDLAKVRDTLRDTARLCREAGWLVAAGNCGTAIARIDRLQASQTVLAEPSMALCSECKHIHRTDITCKEVWASLPKRHYGNSSSTIKTFTREDLAKEQRAKEIELDEVLEFAKTRSQSSTASQTADVVVPDGFGLPIDQEPKYTVNAQGRLINRATGVAIPDDEPVFILRAKDMFAVKTLHLYAQSLNSPRSSHFVAVQYRIEDFRRFAKDFRERLKFPDTAAPQPEPSKTETGNGWARSQSKADVALSLSKNAMLKARNIVPKWLYEDMKRALDAISDYRNEETKP